MTSYLKSAPIGWPGDITRPDETNVEPIMLVGVGSPLVYPLDFGQPLKYVTGGAQQFNGGAETAASFAGILVREVPSQAGDRVSDSVFSPCAPNPAQPQGMAVRGYVTVKCGYGTPARGGVVYVRIIANGNGVVGAFEATSDGGNNVALTAAQAEWASDGLGADGAGNTNIAEIRIAR